MYFETIIVFSLVTSGERQDKKFNKTLTKPKLH